MQLDTTNHDDGNNSNNSNNSNGIDSSHHGRRSRRHPVVEPLQLPDECELVAGTFIVFQWHGRYCTLQNNVTMYCWGRRRSGAIEHVLERYGWTHSPQLHRVSSKMVDGPRWRWLQLVFDTTQRLFDDKEIGDTLGRVHWLNIMDCRLVFELLRRSSAEDGTGPMFPARSSTAVFMNPTPFTKYVKATFGKYTEGGKAPNPSLLRSIFTTWLYGLRYDTEDAFLAQIKASSARWKAHTEQIAASVYNKELVYQQREFAVLLQFCEAYSSRDAYDASTVDGVPDADAGLSAARWTMRWHRQRRRRTASSQASFNPQASR